MPASKTSSPRVVRICANGKPPTSRATPTRYAAHQPFSHASAAAADPESGDTAAAASASTSSGATTGAASAFAGTANSWTEGNCSQTIGAVASPHAPEIATTGLSLP